MCVQLHSIILFIESKLYKELRPEVIQYNVWTAISLMLFNQLYYIHNCFISSYHYTRGILFINSTLEFYLVQGIKNVLCHLKKQPRQI